MYQHSTIPSLPRIDQLGIVTDTTSRQPLRVVNPDFDTETRIENPFDPEIQPSLDLPPRFRKFLGSHSKDSRFQSAIKWYQTKLTASDVNHRDTVGFTDLEQILRRDTRLSATSALPHWVAKKKLGRGKYGQVVLWERKGETNEQSQYVACKDAQFDKWFQDYCTEAHLTRTLNAAGCINVVKVIDWTSIRSRKIHKILYEYCPHGTLYDLYGFYKIEWVTIPESFLWHVFHSLAAAICYQAYGNTDGKPSPNWIEIVHRDVKPANILLSDPEPNNRNLYPTLKLADYGLAYSIPNNEIRRLKRALWTGGTKGYVAPEADNRVRDDPNQTPHPFASHLSDIYSIGCIMLEFLRLPISRYSKSSWELLDLDLNFAYQFYPYSHDLVDLARACIKPHPKDRPSAIALYQHTRLQAEESYNLVEKASQANSSRPGAAFAGQMLWNNIMQGKYRASGHFRNAYANANDWISTHRHEMRQLDEAAMTPRADAIPPPGHVALGNGLGGFCSLQQLKEGFVGVPLESYLANMMVYDASGRQVVRKGRAPILRFIGQDRLIVPEPNLDWEQTRAAQQNMQSMHREEQWNRARGEEIVEQAIRPGVHAALDEIGGGFPRQPVVLPQARHNSRKEARSRYQPYVTPTKGPDGEAHGRERPETLANPRVVPYTPPLEQQPQKLSRANEAPQDNFPRLAPTEQQDIVALPRDPTPVRRISKPRTKVPGVERAVIQGRVERVGSSRARQQGLLGFRRKRSFGQQDLPGLPPAMERDSGM